MSIIPESTLICSITERVARAYMSHLESEKAISPRTYNNYLSFMVTFFDWIRDKGYLHDNPFSDIRRKPKRLMKKTRRTLTADELRTLFSFLERKNPEYLAVCQLCYCCFMRPKEIALLRFEDVDLEKQTVRVRAEVAKNDSESYRTIPDAMLPTMRRLRPGPPGHYIFGDHRNAPDNFTPGAKPTEHKRFSDYWNRFVRPACGFGLDLKLYSLKDTGITNMLGNGVPISFVQQQADHSSVAMTAIYVGKSPAAREELKGVCILPE